jgi:ADP-ribosyl-[dinitrogen reductase] hydrolase
LIPAQPENIGFLKIAFVWAFYYLKNETTYSEALKEILLQGGDTDTNAAIVGGLLGAA